MQNRIYVAGIAIDYIKDLGITLNTQCVINLIEGIKNDAVASLGDDALVIIVLQEYALTPSAIHNYEKKWCLARLEEEIKKSKNVILIPGSFSAYEESNIISDPEKTKRKITENYSKYLRDVNFRYPSFDKNYQDVQQHLTDKPLNKGIVLQNSSYIISSDAKVKKVKHKKSSPWHEEERLPSTIKNKNPCFYHLGGDELVKTTRINEQSLDIGLVICFENRIPISETIKNNPPALEIMVSDTKDPIISNLFGAANICMDSRLGLNVCVNDKHPKSSEIKEIKAFCYYPMKKNVTDKNADCHKTESIVYHVDSDIKHAPPPAPASKPAPAAHNPSKISTSSLQAVLESGITMFSNTSSTLTDIEKEKINVGNVCISFKRNSHSASPLSQYSLVTTEGGVINNDKCLLLPANSAKLLIDASKSGINTLTSLLDSYGVTASRVAAALRKADHNLAKTSLSLG